MSRAVLEVDLEATLKAYKRRLEESFGERLVSLRLFGSRARGDAELDSDADVAVVIRGLTDSEREQAVTLAFDTWRDNGYRGPLPSPLVWSQAQVLDRRRAERRLVLDIETQGIPL
ncbi:MAG: nucleotidyltransferase domain-containing protein [Polyangiaceae bacterium]|nr:nucleotidyltransferase domain-containing protein [Polyangiaceae bacterium]